MLNRNSSIVQTDNKDLVLDIRERLCMCGCGTLIPAYDSKGRPLSYVCGHNRKGKRKIRTPILIHINKIDSVVELRSIVYRQAELMAEKDSYIEELEHKLQQQALATTPIS